MSVNTRKTKGRTYGGEEVAVVVPSDGLNGIFMSCQAEDGGRFLLDVPDLDLHADISAHYPQHGQVSELTTWSLPALAKTPSAVPFHKTCPTFLPPCADAPFPSPKRATGVVQSSGHTHPSSCQPENLSSASWKSHRQILESSPAETSTL